MPQIGKMTNGIQIQEQSVWMHACSYYGVLFFRILLFIYLFFLGDREVNVLYSGLMTRFACCHILVNEPFLENCIKAIKESFVPLLHCIVGIHRNKNRILFAQKNFYILPASRYFAVHKSEQEKYICHNKLQKLTAAHKSEVINK